MAGEIEAKVKLNTSEFSSGMESVKSIASGAASAIGSVFTGASAAVGAAIGAATAGIAKLVQGSVQAYGEFEQLAEGAQKIFDQMDYSQISTDAGEAWRTMNISASQYLDMINQVGASFAATMGDAQGYEVAKQGMQAIADYASGTGRNIAELNTKFAMITRSTSSYQSIADQFSGILPATSAGFLEQAQAAGILSTSYKKLTDVPIAEYQQAVSAMLQKGVEDLNLAGNTATETMGTITGSINGFKAAWQNLITGMASGADLSALIDNVVMMAEAVVQNVLPAVSTALQGVVQLVASLAPTIAAELPGLIATVAPMLLSAAVSLVNTLTMAMPGLIQSILTALSGLLPQITMTITTLLDTLVATIIPALLALGLQFIQALGTSLISNAVQLSASLFSLVNYVVEFLIQALPMIIEIGVQLVSALAQGLSENSALLIGGVVALITVVLTTIIANLPTIILAGLQIVSALAQGLLQNMNCITDALVQLIALIPQVIAEHIGEILMAALQIGVAIVEGILMAIPSLIISVGRLIGIVDDAKEGVDRSSNGISNSVQNMAQDFIAGTSNISASLSSLSANIVSSSSSMSASVNSMGNGVNKVMVPVYDSMGNLISQFQATANTSATSTRSITQSASDAQNNAFKSSADIISSSEKAEMSLNRLKDITAAPEVDPSGVEAGCNAIVSAVEKAVTALKGLANASGSASVGSIGARASGGPVSAGSTYLVGEEGPELVTMSRSAYIHNADETADLLSSGKNGSDIYTEESREQTLRDFFKTYLEPFMVEISENTKIQADKPTVTRVQIGQRDIVNAYDSQKKANGYSFVR